MVYEKNYYKKFPTIYHLRHHLCKSKEKEDIRLIYLAIHHILKYRGNFLYENQEFSIDKLDDIKEQLKDALNTVFDFNHLHYLEDDRIEEVISCLHQQSSRKAKADNCVNASQYREAKKVLKEFYYGLNGLKFNVSKLFGDDSLKKTDGDKPKDIEMNFSDDNYDDVLESISEISEEYEQCIENMKAIYSMLILGDILSGKSSISEAMKLKYEDHRADLKELKGVIRENYGLNAYRDMFRNESKKGNYYNYINNSSKTPKDEFYKYTKKVLKGKDNEKNILERIDKEVFMPKQNDRSNGNIPYQLHLDELKKIIENQEEYYPFLMERKDDILKILTFRIPYYYGPFGSKQFGWMIKKEGKEDTRVLPWNHEDVVDVDKTAAKFIKRLTNYCTYLLDEPVMPKKSLTCQMFEVLNELNKIRVDDKLLGQDVKDSIIEDLFMKRKKVPNCKQKLEIR